MIKIKCKRLQGTLFGSYTITEICCSYLSVGRFGSRVYDELDLGLYGLGEMRIL